jgi:hypothetical protein
MEPVMAVFLRSLGIDPPQRKGTSRFETGIYAIDQVKAPVVTRADERLLFTEDQRIERTSELPKHDLNDDQIFFALFIDGENFRYNGGHMRQFRVRNINYRKRDPV